LFAQSRLAGEYDRVSTTASHDECAILINRNRSALKHCTSLAYSDFLAKQDRFSPIVIEIGRDPGPAKSAIERFEFGQECSIESQPIDRVPAGCR
jgi:hypothetical protein